MLTYATLTNRHIPIERLPALQWSLFCRIQDSFEETWDLLPDAEISISDKAQSIERFSNFTEEYLKHADKWGITRWPGGNPLRVVVRDMVQRLVLRYEFLVAETKQQSLKKIIQETSERFPEVSSQIEGWFEKHKNVATPDDLVKVRIDVSRDWSRSGMPKSILANLKTLAKEHTERFPAPCANAYPRDMANLHEATWQLVEELGGQLTVSRETGLNQGNLSKHLRSFSRTPLNTITRVFERAVAFPRLRSKAERDGLMGKDSWLLFQEICPSVADVLHHRFAVRLILSYSVLPPSSWKKWAELETRFVYPMLPSGIRNDFLSNYEKSLMGIQLIDNNRVIFLFIKNPLQVVELNEIFSLLLTLSSPFLTVHPGVEQYTSLIDDKEIFLITKLPDKWQTTGERFGLDNWNPYERVKQAAPHQIRLTTAFAFRWLLSLWSEGLLPPSLLSDRWVSFYSKFSQWLASPDLSELMRDTLDNLMLPMIERSKTF